MHKKMILLESMYHLSIVKSAYLIFSLAGEKWKKSASNKYCENYDMKYVKNQLDCQFLCEVEYQFDCVGITYTITHDTHWDQRCFLCKDDILTSSRLRRHFYRRPRKPNITQISPKIYFNIYL